MVSSVAMMLITTMSSISVKPWSRRLPLAIGNAIEARSFCISVDVENVIAGLRIVGRTLVASEAPRFGRGRGTVRKEGVARQMAHEINFCLVRIACIVHAIDQDFEIRRVARFIGLHQNAT